MDLQELASELNNFDTETFEVKDYIDYAEMEFGSTCSSSSCTSTCSSTSS
ncbi:thiazolylpeptide-type bacteriocin [Cutibacterium acnes]